MNQKMNTISLLKRNISRRGVLLGLGVSAAYSLEPWNRAQQLLDGSLFSPLEPLISGVAGTVDTSTITKPHLETAHTKTLQAVHAQLQPLRDLFRQSRSGAAGFCDVALGWHSKWCLVKDYTPFIKGNRNELFLRREFEQRVLSQTRLMRAIEQCVTGFVSEIESIESEMLVALRRDLELNQADVSLVRISPAEMQAAFNRAIQTASQGAMVGAVTSAGELAVTSVGTFIVYELCTKIAAELGVSAGIVGTGAAASWETLGLSLLAAVIIDSILSAIWNWWSDPRGKLIGQITGKLSQIEGMVCGGDAGLQTQFTKLADARAILRRSAIETMT